MQKKEKKIYMLYSPFNLLPMYESLNSFCHEKNKNKIHATTWHP